MFKGDATNFTHWEELKSTWKFVDVIQDEWTMNEPNFPNYESGTNGPLESDLLLVEMVIIGGMIFSKQRIDKPIVKPLD